jgi:lambda family phage minor tail protein L
MSEGSRQAAEELLSLEPSQMVELFEIKTDEFDDTKPIYRLHNGSIFNGTITWKGVNYEPIPLDLEGFESKSTGQLNRPKLRIQNKNYFVSDILRDSNELKTTVVIRRKTFVKFLDDSNFEGGVNPWGSFNRSEILTQRFIVGQKTQENKEVVEVELTTPLDMETQEVNGRRVFAKYCPFDYRGPGCDYERQPIHRADGASFTNTAGQVMDLRSIFMVYKDPGQKWSPLVNYIAGDISWLPNKKLKQYNDYDTNGQHQDGVTYYVARDVSIDKYPPDNRELWEKDGCVKTPLACSKHFDGGTTRGNVLRFGGFPGTAGFQFRRSY